MASSKSATMEQIMGLMAQFAVNMNTLGEKVITLTEKVDGLAGSVEELAQRGVAAPVVVAAAPRARAAAAAAGSDSEVKPRAPNPWSEFQKEMKAQGVKFADADAKKEAYLEWKATYFPAPAAAAPAVSARPLKGAAGGGGGAQPPASVRRAMATLQAQHGDEDIDE